METAPRSLRATLVGGASALAAVSLVERACAFGANLLAARLSGVQAFGAYSLALTTANNVATYAGAGIGTTANRFAGRQRPGTPGYTKLVRSLALVSGASAALAVIVLLAGAGPLARLLLRNPALTSLLEIAALMSGVMIVTESLRGFFVGERLYRRLTILALCGGIGMLVLLPTASLFGPHAMVAAHAVAWSAAAAACLWLRPASPSPAPPAIEESSAVPPPSASAIWRFGLVQFASLVGLNAAGWWVFALVGRADTTLAGAGIFAIANQLRNLVSLAPNLLVQSSYALLAAEPSGRTHGVLVHSTVLAALWSVILGGSVAAVAGWAVPFIFGASFQNAGLVVAIAMATAIVHMTSAPASARLTIVSLRASGWINAVWTVITIVLATWLVPRWGVAAAMGVYLIAHLLSLAAVYIALRRIEPTPPIGGMLLAAVTVAITIAVLAIVRAANLEYAPVVSALMFAVTVIVALGLMRHGAVRGWLPNRVSLGAIGTLWGRAAARWMP